MKVTFPHMGKMSISVEAMLKEMGFEVIVPPPITNKTLDLGVKYSPEAACLPLKINVGNYIEALEKGADTIIMGGGVGPCRFGYYGEVQEEILNDLGYDFEMIILGPNQSKLNNLFTIIKKTYNDISILKLKSALQKGWSKAKALDEIKKEINKIRPYLKARKKGSQLYETTVDKIADVDKIIEVEKVVADYQAKLDNMEKRDNYQALRVGIVGEIYVVLEEFTNLNIEKKLGERGIVVDKSIYLTKWIREHLLPEFMVDNNEKEKVKAAAKPYLNHFVGGHGLESVGETVLYDHKGYDGVIQLFPFTCMPEIIAENIFPVLSKELNLSILSLSIDEHTGEAGYLTRIEAFIDLLKRKKEREIIV